MTFQIVTALALGVCLLGSRPIGVRADELLQDPITPFSRDVLEQLRAKQFSELEKLENELRTSKERFRGGDWKLHHFYHAMSGGLVLTQAAIESDWLELINLLQEWRSASPKSAVPSLLLANTFAGYGWHARTTKRAVNVTERQFAVFKDRLNQGAFYLTESRRLSNNNPQWFATALRIALGLEWDKARATTLFDQAMTLEPLYQHTYVTMAVFLLPRWYGEPGEWERFASVATERVGGQQGSAIYNHIIVRLSPTFSRAEMFRDNDLHWRRIQWSFADRERLYGESREAVNAMSFLAGAAGDKTAARDFMARIGESWEPSVWTTRQRFDEYQAWLKTDEP